MGMGDRQFSENKNRQQVAQCREVPAVKGHFENRKSLWVQEVDRGLVTLHPSETHKDRGGKKTVIEQ